MRMSRGSGITGLCAMQKVMPLPVAFSRSRSRKLLLARPLLEIPKARLIATLARAKIPYADDVSNRDPRFARARMRAAMPAIAREGLTAQRIALFARRLARAENALESVVDRAAAEVSEQGWGKDAPIVLDASKFLRLPDEIAIRLLGRALAHVGGSSIRLGKLEALHAALATAKLSPSFRLRRTLAGALLTLTPVRLVVEPAPPRTRPSRSRLHRKCPTGRNIKKKRDSLGTGAPAT